MVEMFDRLSRLERIYVNEMFSPNKLIARGLIEEAQEAANGMVDYVSKNSTVKHLHMRYRPEGYHLFDAHNTTPDNKFCLKGYAQILLRYFTALESCTFYEPASVRITVRRPEMFITVEVLKAH